MKPPQISDPWSSGYSNSISGVGAVNIGNNSDTEENSTKEHHINYEKYFDDDAEEHLTVVYQAQNGTNAAAGELVGIFRVHHPEIECECIQRVYAEERLERVAFEKAEGDIIRVGERVMTIATRSKRELSSLLRNETTKRMQVEVFLDVDGLRTRLNIKPNRIYLQKWWHELGAIVPTGGIICSIMVDHCSGTDRLDVIADADITLKEKNTPENLEIRQEMHIALIQGECPVEMDYLCHFAWHAQGEIGVVEFAPCYELNTHCKVLEISNSLMKGCVKKGDKLLRLQCFEGNDSSSVRCTAEIIALQDLDSISLLVEKGSILNLGDKVFSAPAFEDMPTEELVRVDLINDLLRYGELYDGNTHCKVASISDILARGSIKRGGEVMTIECYGDHDPSKVSVIATIFALVDLDKINLRVENGSILKPGDEILWSPNLEKIEITDAFRVEVNEYAADTQGNIEATVYSFKEAKSFDATMILRRLHQDKRQQMEVSRDASNKRSTSLAAGTAIISLAATVTGFSVVASILTLIRMTAQSSSGKVEVDKDLEHSFLVAEEVRQLLVNHKTRLGEAQGRFFGIISEGIKMFSITQSSARGLHLVELSFAGNTPYLEEGALRNCLANNFNDTELEDIWSMLLPINTIAIKGARIITPSEAVDNDQFYQVCSNIGTPYRIELSDSKRLYLYKIPIPPHSDF